MKPPPKVLRPRALQAPWSVAPEWMTKMYMPKGLWPLVICSHIWAVQLVAWALLVAVWIPLRMACALWNWVWLPILLAAHYRFQARRARRRGDTDTVASAMLQQLPPAARAGHAINSSTQAVFQLPAAPAAPAMAPVVYPPGRAPEVTQVIPIIQPDGTILYEPWTVRT